MKESITGTINLKVLEILENNPKGIHWSELIDMIQKEYPDFHPKTINGCIWKLVSNFPDKVYKPEKGLFRLIKYKD